MSCLSCGNNETNVTTANCPCDLFVHPLPLKINAGLPRLPRQIAGFPEFRRAMLHLLQTEQVTLIDEDNKLVKIRPLLRWRGRGADDLGIMLLEMWSYVCDALSFYDEVIANTAYIRTATLRPDIRRLVALLGYRPRPAVGSSVQLAAVAEGRLPVKLPAGTAFRSGAFDGNPPQVFELHKDVTVHPLANKWNVVPPQSGVVQQNFPSSLLINPVAVIKENAFVLLVNVGNQNYNSALQVQQLDKYTGWNKQQYSRILFSKASKLTAGSLLTQLNLLQPTQVAKLWTLNNTAASATTTTLVMESQLPLFKANDYIIVSRDNELRWFKLQQVKEVNRQPMPASDMYINGNKFQMPGIFITVTSLILDVPLNDAGRKAPGAADWSSSMVNDIVVHYGLQLAANIIEEPQQGLMANDPINFSGFVEKPVDDISATEFLLQDVNTRGAVAQGAVDFDRKKLTLGQGVAWQPELRLPVTVFGNVITAQRGERVLNEKLGSGNAVVPNQTFKLKKKPLTYYLSPTAANNNGVDNTLVIYVNGISWTEVSSFYGQQQHDQVYIVRQNDDGDTLVTFGDGIRGERVPTGVDNIIANYQFGAEVACPPAGSVNQIAKPIKGLQSVKNIVAAYGGAAAEDEISIKTNAPRSALILGRVVSLKDMEAVTASFPGVNAVSTEWRWAKHKQTAAAHIYYIGNSGLQQGISQRLRNLSDPSVAITVEQAAAVSLSVSINVKIDNRYRDLMVMDKLRNFLMDETTGILSASNIGIGAPLYQSRLFEAILSVEGTVAVDSLFLNGKNFAQYAVTPGAGRYFDVTGGGLMINGTNH